MNLSSKIKIFVLGHSDESFKNIPNKPHLQKINLSNLLLPIPNTNDLAENRFFLLDESFFKDCPDYIGVLSSSYESKYQNLIGLENLVDIAAKISPKIIYAPSPTAHFNNGKWVEWSEHYHGNNMLLLMKEITSLYNVRLENKPTFWANNFICHKSVFLDFIAYFKIIFEYMHEKYKYNFDIRVDDKSRIAAYVYERVSMIYFSRRNDLEIIRIPSRSKISIDSILWIASSASNYKPIFDFWYNSLKRIGVKDEAICHTTIIPPQNMKTEVKFQEDIWYYCIKTKIEKLIETLEAHQEKSNYKFFISSDCDIQFFTKKEESWDTLLQYINSTDFDIYFQPEKVSGICGGFYIIKQNRLKTAINFLKNVLARFKITPKQKMLFADQSVMIELLHTINSCVIPEVCCILGPVLDVRNKNIYIFHHAICAYNMEEKLIQLQAMHEIMEK
jgi:hypothetical protein